MVQLYSNFKHVCIISLAILLITLYLASNTVGASIGVNDYSDRVIQGSLSPSDMSSDTLLASVPEISFNKPLSETTLDVHESVHLQSITTLQDDSDPDTTEYGDGSFFNAAGITSVTGDELRGLFHSIRIHNHPSSLQRVELSGTIVSPQPFPRRGTARVRLDPILRAVSYTISYQFRRCDGVWLPPGLVENTNSSLDIEDENDLCFAQFRVTYNPARPQTLELSLAGSSLFLEMKLFTFSCSDEVDITPGISSLHAKLEQLTSNSFYISSPAFVNTGFLSISDAINQIRCQLVNYDDATLWSYKEHFHQGVYRCDIVNPTNRAIDYELDIRFLSDNLLSYANEMDGESIPLHILTFARISTSTSGPYTPIVAHTSFTLPTVMSGAPSRHHILCHGPTYHIQPHHLSAREMISKPAGQPAIPYNIALEGNSSHNYSFDVRLAGTTTAQPLSIILTDTSSELTMTCSRAFGRSIPTDPASEVFEIPIVHVSSTTYQVDTFPPSHFTPDSQYNDDIIFGCVISSEHPIESMEFEPLQPQYIGSDFARRAVEDTPVIVKPSKVNIHITETPIYFDSDRNPVYTPRLFTDLDELYSYFSTVSHPEQLPDVPELFPMALSPRLEVPQASLLIPFNSGAGNLSIPLAIEYNDIQDADGATPSQDDITRVTLMLSTAIFRSMVCYLDGNRSTPYHVEMATDHMVILPATIDASGSEDDDSGETNRYYFCTFSHPAQAPAPFHSFKMNFVIDKYEGQSSLSHRYVITLDQSFLTNRLQQSFSFATPKPSDGSGDDDDDDTDADTDGSMEQTSVRTTSSLGSSIQENPLWNTITLPTLTPKTVPGFQQFLDDLQPNLESYYSVVAFVVPYGQMNFTIPEVLHFESVVLQYLNDNVPTIADDPLHQHRVHFLHPSVLENKQIDFNFTPFSYVNDVDHENDSRDRQYPSDYTTSLAQFLTTSSLDQDSDAEAPIYSQILIATSVYIGGAQPPSGAPRNAPPSAAVATFDLAPLHNAAWNSISTSAMTNLSGSLRTLTHILSMKLFVPSKPFHFGQLEPAVCRDVSTTDYIAWLTFPHDVNPTLSSLQENSSDQTFPFDCTRVYSPSGIAPFDYRLGTATPMNTGGAMSHAGRVPGHWRADLYSLVFKHYTFVDTPDEANATDEQQPYIVHPITQQRYRNPRYQRQHVKSVQVPQHAPTTTITEENIVDEVLSYYPPSCHRVLGKAYDIDISEHITPIPGIDETDSTLHYATCAQCLDDLSIAVVVTIPSDLSATFPPRSEPLTDVRAITVFESPLRSLYEMEVLGYINNKQYEHISAHLAPLRRFCDNVIVPLAISIPESTATAGKDDDALLPSAPVRQPSLVPLSSPLHHSSYTPIGIVNPTVNGHVDFRTIVDLPNHILIPFSFITFDPYKFAHHPCQLEVTVSTRIVTGIPQMYPGSSAGSPVESTFETTTTHHIWPVSPRLTGQFYPTSSSNDNSNEESSEDSVTTVDNPYQYLFGQQYEYTHHPIHHIIIPKPTSASTIGSSDVNITYQWSSLPPFAEPTDEKLSPDAIAQGKVHQGLCQLFYPIYRESSQGTWADDSKKIISKSFTSQIDASDSTAALAPLPPTHSEALGEVALSDLFSKRRSSSVGAASSSSGSSSSLPYTSCVAANTLHQFILYAPLVQDENDDDISHPEVFCRCAPHFTGMYCETSQIATVSASGSSTPTVVHASPSAFRFTLPSFTKSTEDDDGNGDDHDMVTPSDLFGILKSIGYKLQNQKGYLGYNYEDILSLLFNAIEQDISQVYIDYITMSLWDDIMESGETPVHAFDMSHAVVHIPTIRVVGDIPLFTGIPPVAATSAGVDPGDGMASFATFGNYQNNPLDFTVIATAIPYIDSSSSQPVSLLPSLDSIQGFIPLTRTVEFLQGFGIDVALDPSAGSDLPHITLHPLSSPDQPDVSDSTPSALCGALLAHQSEQFSPSDASKLQIASPPSLFFASLRLGCPGYHYLEYINLGDGIDFNPTTPEEKQHIATKAGFITLQSAHIHPFILELDDEATSQPIDGFAVSLNGFIPPSTLLSQHLASDDIPQSESSHPALYLRVFGVTGPSSSSSSSSHDQPLTFLEWITNDVLTSESSSYHPPQLADIIPVSFEALKNAFKSSAKPLTANPPTLDESTASILLHRHYYQQYPQMFHFSPDAAQIDPQGVFNPEWTHLLVDVLPSETIRFHETAQADEDESGEPDALDSNWSVFGTSIYPSYLFSSLFAPHHSPEVHEVQKQGDAVRLLASNHMHSPMLMPLSLVLEQPVEIVSGSSESGNSATKVSFPCRDLLSNVDIDDIDTIVDVPDYATNKDQWCDCFAAFDPHFYCPSESSDEDDSQPDGSPVDAANVLTRQYGRIQLAHSANEDNNDSDTLPSLKRVDVLTYLKGLQVAFKALLRSHPSFTLDTPILESFISRVHIEFHRMEEYIPDNTPAAATTQLFTSQDVSNDEHWIDYIVVFQLHRSSDPATTEQQNTADIDLFKTHVGSAWEQFYKSIPLMTNHQLPLVRSGPAYSTAVISQTAVLEHVDAYFLYAFDRSTVFIRQPDEDSRGYTLSVHETSWVLFDTINELLPSPEMLGEWFCLKFGAPSSCPPPPANQSDALEKFTEMITPSQPEYQGYAFHDCAFYNPKLHPITDPEESVDESIQALLDINTVSHSLRELVLSCYHPSTGYRLAPEQCADVELPTDLPILDCDLCSNTIQIDSDTSHQVTGVLVSTKDDQTCVPTMAFNIELALLRTRPSSPLSSSDPVATDDGDDTDPTPPEDDSTYTEEITSATKMKLGDTLQFKWSYIGDPTMAFLIATSYSPLQTTALHTNPVQNPTLSDNDRIIRGAVQHLQLNPDLGKETTAQSQFTTTITITHDLLGLLRNTIPPHTASTRATAYSLDGFDIYTNSQETISGAVDITTPADANGALEPSRKTSIALTNVNDSTPLLFPLGGVRVLLGLTPTKPVHTSMISAGSRRLVYPRVESAAIDQSETETVTPVIPSVGLLSSVVYMSDMTSVVSNCDTMLKTLGITSTRNIQKQRKFQQYCMFAEQPYGQDAINALSEWDIVNNAFTCNEQAPADAPICQCPYGQYYLSIDKIPSPAPAPTPTPPFSQYTVKNNDGDEPADPEEENPDDNDGGGHGDGEGENPDEPDSTDDDDDDDDNNTIEIHRCINACDGYCFNNGACTFVGPVLDSFSTTPPPFTSVEAVQRHLECICPPGFSGPRCEHRECLVETPLHLRLQHGLGERFNPCPGGSLLPVKDAPGSEVPPATHHACRADHRVEDSITQPGTPFSAAQLPCQCDKGFEQLFAEDGKTPQSLDYSAEGLGTFNVCGCNADALQCAPAPQTDEVLTRTYGQCARCICAPGYSGDRCQHRVMYIQLKIAEESEQQPTPAQFTIQRDVEHAHHLHKLKPMADGDTQSIKYTFYHGTSSVKALNAQAVRPLVEHALTSIQYLLYTDVAAGDEHLSSSLLPIRQHFIPAFNHLLLPRLLVHHTISYSSTQFYVPFILETVRPSGNDNDDDTNDNDGGDEATPLPNVPDGDHLLEGDENQQPDTNDGFISLTDHEAEELSLLLEVISTITAPKQAVKPTSETSHSDSAHQSLQVPPSSFSPLSTHGAEVSSIFTTTADDPQKSVNRVQYIRRTGSALDWTSVLKLPSTANVQTGALPSLQTVQLKAIIVDPSQCLPDGSYRLETTPAHFPELHRCQDYPLVLVAMGYHSEKVSQNAMILHDASMQSSASHKATATTTVDRSSVVYYPRSHLVGLHGGLAQTITTGTNIIVNGPDDNTDPSGGGGTSTTTILIICLVVAVCLLIVGIVIAVILIKRREKKHQEEMTSVVQMYYNWD